MFLKHLIIGVFFNWSLNANQLNLGVVIFTTPSVSKRGQNSKPCIVIDT